MRFRIGEQTPGVWRVLHDAAIIGPAYASRAEALTALTASAAVMQALTAAAGDASVGFTIPWGIAEKVETQDRRMFDTLNFRDTPLPLMFQSVIPEFGGHAGGEFVGAITDTAKDASGVLSCSGMFVTEPEGVRAASLIEQGLRGVSADTIAPNYEIEIREIDEDGWPTDWLETYFDGIVCGFTVTPHPAFQQAFIEVTGAESMAASGAFVPPSESGSVITVYGGGSNGSILPAGGAGGGLSLVACGCEEAPPAEWFTDPGFTDVTPLTITPEGRVFGHFAAWGTCHTGYPGQCVTPPRSTSGYAHFHNGELVCADGSKVRVGQLTYAGPHAPNSLNMREAQAHYDNTTKAWADVVAGEDQFGPWIAGALRSGLSEADLRAVRAAGLSGDWRDRGGHLETIAVHSVSGTGFPLARVASGGLVLSLVAGTGVVGKPDRGSDVALTARVARLERLVARGGVADLAAQALDAALVR